MEHFPAKTPKEERLLRMYREPEVGGFLDANETGEHYLLNSTRHAGKLYLIPNACRFENVRRATVELMVEQARIRSEFSRVGILIGIATGGLPLLFELQRDSFFMFTEAIWVDPVRDPRQICELKKRREERLKKKIHPGRPEFILARNFTIDPNKTALLVDDVYTTGGSISAAMDACNDPVNEHNWKEEDSDRMAEAYVIGAIVAVNRAPVKRLPSEVLMPTLALCWGLRDPLEDYLPENCPFCRDGIPLVQK